MADYVGPIRRWERGDTIPTNAEGGFAGADSTKAAIDQVGDVAAKVSEKAFAGIMAAAWDGSVATGDSAPVDEGALWIDGDNVVRQHVGGSTVPPTNYARQTATHSTTGITASVATNLRMASGRVTATTGTGSGARIAVSNTAYGAQVTPGQSLTMSADVGGGASGHASTYALRIVWHDAAGTIVSSQTGAYTALSTSGDRRSITATVPAGVAFACLNFVSAGAATVIADIWVTKIAATLDGSTGYISGDTPGWAWTGVPGESTSVPTYTGPWQIVTTISGLLHRRSTGAGVLLHPEERAALDARARRLHARTSPRAQVALLVDDYPADTLNLWAPACASRGIPWSWAIPGGIFEPGHKYAAYVGGKTWADVAALDPAVVELVNHSWSHDDVTAVEAMWREVIESRDEIRAQTGRDCLGWTPPGNDLAEGLRWRTAPLMASSGAELIYTESTAGRLILGGHAWATDTLTRPGDGVVNTAPRDGAPSQLTGRVWVDNTATDVAIAPGGRADVAVQTAVDRGHGVILSLHPTHIEGGMAGTNKMTTAAVGAWLDRLAARRTAGDIDIVLMTPWQYTRIG